VVVLLYSDLESDLRFFTFHERLVHWVSYDQVVHPSAKEETPTFSQAIAFGLKASCFRTRRLVQDFREELPRFPLAAIDDTQPVIAESRTVLYSSRLGSEFGLQAGKVHNLRVAARYLNGVSLPAGGLFSFWKQVPRPTRGRGFTEGRELREGCIIPSVGGGLCQLSNALYECALDAGLEIVERHAHSRILPGSMAEQGRDATIFWNYVDLRLRTEVDLQIEVILGRGELVVRFRSSEKIAPVSKESETNQTVSPPPDAYSPAGDPVESCETCGVTSCFRHPETHGLAKESMTSWLVDAFWPEHGNYLTQNRKGRDWLFSPLRSRGYQWGEEGFARVRTSPWLTLRRSLASRRLAQQGAARQRMLLSFDEKLAASYARRIPPAATHLVISQNLLPFLWRAGVLGGRTFDVLMTRLPLKHLQGALDQAAARWPESSTLSDFRADPELLRDEASALNEAEHWITPHSEIARRAGARAVKLDWQIPPCEKPAEAGSRLLFPATTLGRKGAWEIRELDCRLTISGPILESADFWEGRDVEHREFSIEDVAAVILPASVENQPRRLLQAVAAGIPVIASDACGLEGVDGVTVVETGNVPMLKAAVESLLSRNRSCGQSPP